MSNNDFDYLNICEKICELSETGELNYFNFKANDDDNLSRVLIKFRELFDSDELLLRSTIHLPFV